MNAQEIWKSEYLYWKNTSYENDTMAVINMRRYRREAALERLLAAQQRQHTIDTLEIAQARLELIEKDKRIAELESEMQRIYQNERDAV